MFTIEQIIIHFFLPMKYLLPFKLYFLVLQFTKFNIFVQQFIFSSPYCTRNSFKSLTIDEKNILVKFYLMFVCMLKASFFNICVFWKNSSLVLKVSVIMNHGKLDKSKFVIKTPLKLSKTYRLLKNTRKR